MASAPSSSTSSSSPSAVTSAVKLSIRSHWVFALLLVMGRFFALDMYRASTAQLTGVDEDALRKLHGLATLALTGMTAMLVLEKVYLLVFKVRRPHIANPIVKGTIEWHFSVYLLATLAIWYPNPTAQLVGEWTMVAYAPILALEKLYLVMSTKASPLDKKKQ